MKEKIKNIYYQNKSVILYLIFGVLSTVVNILVYALCSKILHINYAISNVISWIFAVTFAYLTNRVYVFDSNANTKKSVIKEIILFYYYRIVTLILEFILLYLGITLLHIDDLIVKIIANVIVIVANYIFSKFLIFKNKNK